jgi:hypothetical protein
MANQPIPIETANEMIAAYISYMKSHGIDMDKQTQSVSFTFNELQAWLNSIAPYSDELRVCMGVYTSGKNAGRITTILWPYKNGEPATELSGSGPSGGLQPYNEGNGTP